MGQLLFANSYVLYLTDFNYLSVIAYKTQMCPTSLYLLSICKSKVSTQGMPKNTLFKILIAEKILHHIFQISSIKVSNLIY